MNGKCDVKPTEGNMQGKSKAKGLVTLIRIIVGNENICKSILWHRAKGETGQKFQHDDITSQADNHIKNVYIKLGRLTKYLFPFLFCAVHNIRNTGPSLSPGFLPRDT